MAAETIVDQSNMPDGTQMQSGRYKICMTLGNGGFGITYKAWDSQLLRYVAVKEFFPDGLVYRDTDCRAVHCFREEQTFQSGKQRFRHEAQTLANLDFPHIVKVYDSFEENNTAYIVMEYISGETLTQYVEKQSSMNSAHLLELFLPLMKDLDALHKRGIVHRDISPDNIMITEDTGTLKLIDFGTAKDLTASSEKSKSLSVSHTVVRMSYSPIEMFSLTKKFPTADIYALSATMYFCLTGKEPPTSLDRAFDDTLKIPSANSCDKRLENAVYRGMALRPEDRYPSVEKLIQALTEKEPHVNRPILLMMFATLALLALTFSIVILLITWKKNLPAKPNNVNALQDYEISQNSAADVAVTEDEKMSSNEDSTPLQAEIAAAEEEFGETVTAIRLTGSSSMDVYTYQTAAAQIEPRAQVLTDGKYRIWTDNTGFNTYVLLPDSLFGQENPMHFLRGTAVMLSTSGDTYFYASPNNYKRIWPADIVDAFVQKDAKGQNEIYIRLTDAAAERVSSVFDNAQDKTVHLYMDPSLSFDGKILLNAFGYDNLIRDEDNPAVFHCYGDYAPFGDAQVKIVQTFIDVMKTGNTGGALESKIIYTPVWESAADSEAGAYQVAALDEPAIRAMYSFNRSGEDVIPDSWKPAVNELKKRLDLLRIPYVFGQAAIDDGIIFVELPLSEIPYEALALLPEGKLSFSVGTPFWKASGCNCTALSDGGIRAEIPSWADKNVRPGYTELINETVDSQPIYLFAKDRKVLQAELTAYPEDGKIEFRELLLQNADGTWDGAGFMELLGYIAEQGKFAGALSNFRLSEITLINGAKDGYLVSAQPEEQKRLRNALAGDYPDVEVGVVRSISPQLQICFNFDIDAQLPAKTLEAAQRVYDLIKDGNMDDVTIFFIEERREEWCRAAFYADSYSTHRMGLSFFRFSGGRLECYEEDFRSLYAASTFIQSLGGALIETVAAPEASPEESLTMDDAGYYLFQEDIYGVSCPFPADFAIDQTAAGETLLMRANSMVNRNYIEVHGMTLPQAMTGKQAMERAEAELGGHVNFHSYGDSWFACSVDSENVGIYRKGKLRADGTIIVWFDYYVMDSDDTHAACIEYIEDHFTSNLQ